MRLRHIAILSALIVSALFSAAASSAMAAGPACAGTGESSNASPGAPCWTDVQPYPFGVDGEPVQTPDCASAAQTPAACYAVVQSMAFRSWNRGLALMQTETANGGSPPDADADVWTYNGTDWAPNPSFPGFSACPDGTIMWAGKLDYWVVGQELAGSGAPVAWPALCRYDGADFVWQTVPIPAAVTAAEPTGEITSGACFAWNDCWFFGTAGVELHWDGTALATVSTGLGSSPWLMGDYLAAAAGTDADGNEFGVAVSEDQETYLNSSEPLPAQPDGSPPPQVFASTGGPFEPTALEPPSDGGDQGTFPDPTLLDALGFNAAGLGWLAGAPIYGSDSNIAPLIPVTEQGQERACPAISSATFPSSTYAWTSVGTLPDGDALAGGLLTSNGTEQPVIVDASCSAGATQTLFTTPGDEGSSSAVTSLSVSADNDAWAGTGYGSVGDLYTPPQLYQYTDGQRPDAPAGDDNEVRIVNEPSEPTLYETPPTVVVPPPPPPILVTTAGVTKRRTVKLPSPVYDVKVANPVAAGGDSFTLDLTFRVRRTVTIGAEALQGRRIVARSGLHTFRGHTGRLTLVVQRTAWPTGLKFVLPKAKK